MKKTKEQTILDAAMKMAQSTSTWADLSNALFDPEDGLVVSAFPNESQREAFLKTNEYKAIRGLIKSAKMESGLVEGATPKKSGKFIVRLPRSLHAALDLEAQREGVSLNQLVVTKLAMQLARTRDDH